MYGEKSRIIYDTLIKNHLVGSEGSIKIELLGVSYLVNDKSSIGNLIQEWLGAWMLKNNIYFRAPDNSQEFPDFYLDNSEIKNLLEVKCFDFSASPNFDIANFDAYIRSLLTKPYRLDADYLIFGYTLHNGILKIENIWLKKIWEITCPSEQFSLRVQVKQGKIFNIRPYNFKNMSQGYKPFGSKREFIFALRNTLNEYKFRNISGDSWYKSFLSVGN